MYFISNITPGSLVKAYQALEVQLSGRVGVKLSTGEGENSNYLRPELIGDLVKSLNAAIVECNTGYAGTRSSTAMHMQVARDRGYTDIAEVDILDAADSLELPVEGSSVISVDYEGSHFVIYDAYLVLSRFKGHAMPDSESLIARIESLNGLYKLDAAEAIGLGCRDCHLVIPG